MILQTRISELRKSLDLSQERLAERIGVSRQAVAKWESGETLPELEHLIRLGKLFSVSIDSLLMGADACSAAAGAADLGPNAEAIAFLCRAKRATYAGRGPKAEPTRPDQAPTTCPIERARSSTTTPTSGASGSAERKRSGKAMLRSGR
jgi:transcriptional regulator with XRE-family HTH domain